jgi:hypothetical protein
VEFHEKLAKQGLAVMMVSTEAKGIVGKYVADNKIPFFTAVADESLDADFGVEGYPSSYLIDENGRVLWAGHPMALREAAVAEALKTVAGARLGEVAASLAPAKADFEKQRFAEARKKAQAVLDKAGASDAEKADAQKVLDRVEQIAAARLERAGAAEGEGDFAACVEELKWVQERFKGMDAEKAAREKEKEVRAKPEAKRELDAAAAFDRLLQQEAAVKKPKDKKALMPLFDAFLRKYEGTKASLRAEKKVNSLSRLE